MSDLYKKLKWETLSTEILHKNPWIEYKHDKFKLPNGKTGNYYYVDSNNAVSIIPVTNEGKIICIKTYRYLSDSISIELPAGGQLSHQTTKEAALAELKEETGYIAHELKQIFKYQPSNGIIKFPTYVFVATELEKGNQELEETELGMQVIEYSLAEINELIDKGEISDGFMIVAIKLYENYLKNKLDK